MRFELAGDKIKEAHQNPSNDEPNERRAEHRNDHLVKQAPPRVPGFARRGRGPNNHIPIRVGRGQSRADQSPHERMTGTGGQTDPPGDQVPDNAADQAADHGGIGDVVGVDQPLADGCGHSRAGQGPKKIRHDGEHERLPGREGSCSDDRGDGVGRVVETIDEFKDQRHQNDDEDQRHSGTRL